MLESKKKQIIIKKYATHEGDTGSAQVQIAILTEEIKELADHLKTHKKDFSSRRGLLRKVNLRRKLLKHLEKDDQAAYIELADKLKIKKHSFPEKMAGRRTDDEIETDLAAETEEGAETNELTGNKEAK